MKETDYQSCLGEKAKASRLPRHVAIIMDGNGRWAQKRQLPRQAGHKQGQETVRTIVKSCLHHNIPVLTLFAFGKENWKRPSKEVRNLFRLFYLAIKREVQELHRQNVRLRVLGETDVLATSLVEAIQEAEQLTKNNDALTVNFLINYSGRWDIEQALFKTLGYVSCEQEAKNLFRSSLCLAGLPEPDLFIRTAGVQRLSNFTLWDLAYTELYFTPVPWPQFGEQDFNDALAFYAQQERRFGLISEQVEEHYA